ncbi:NUDIX domain-containing protein [Bizionia gelidisalsuginis]|uniref:NUDIX domain-containing protein n=2 Tax=Bizionia TaxID=283785 RepID=A0A8H2QEN7_9FLAO|nr:MULTISPECIES: NUDIX domain-containing protein [Bizionia]TYB72645.1 NUDIX domain-containing protein [Bizionia saleffrena]TYC18114.1 NUDIX domain-containing protein [Bizionia gelidisalsuginis]
MTEECIDIVTQTGEATGKTALKSEIHSQGLYHNTAHIWFYTKDGYILLQQRAASKAIYPLLWDVSVSGHVDAGESITNGGIRETQEEIGLKITTSDLHKIGVFDCFKSYNNGIIDNEFHHTFMAELKVPLSELVPQVEEVEALKLVTFEAFKVLLKHSTTNGHFVASNYRYYLKVLKSIEQRSN